MIRVVLGAYTVARKSGFLNTRIGESTLDHAYFVSVTFDGWGFPTRSARSVRRWATRLEQCKSGLNPPIMWPRCTTAPDSRVVTEPLSHVRPGMTGLQEVEMMTSWPF